jgi:sporulation protein YlmC with PRC-barrel domain
MNNSTGVDDDNNNTSFINAEVFSSDGKRIGKVQEKHDGFIIVYKKGLLTDEKFRIPVESIAEVKNIIKDENKGHSPSVMLSISEEVLKHAYEFIKGRPNSEFIHGLAESEPKFRLEKQLIFHEPPAPADKDDSLVRRTTSPPSVEKKHQAAIPNDPEKQYLCDMCTMAFMQPEDLQKHRAKMHKAPTNI